MLIFMFIILPFSDTMNIILICVFHIAQVLSHPVQEAAMAQSQDYMCGYLHHHTKLLETLKFRGCGKLLKEETLPGEKCVFIN